MSCNCGNRLTPKWLDRKMDKVFSEACYEHDRDYFNQKGKIKSDVKFLLAMFMTILDLVGRLSIGLIMILPMFISVLIFGFSSYNIREEE